jgi:hypothetical protein
LRCPYQAKVMNTLEKNSRMMVFIDSLIERGKQLLYMLRSSNYLDTHAAGSYNRRPLSPGTSAGQ